MWISRLLRVRRSATNSANRCKYPSSSGGVEAVFVILIWNGSLTALMSGAKHRIDRDFHERIRRDVLRIEEATAELTPLAQCSRGCPGYGGAAGTAGTMGHRSYWLDGVLPAHLRMDGLLVGLESAGPSGVAVRSADGVRIVAVGASRFQPNQQ